MYGVSGTCMQIHSADSRIGLHNISIFSCLDIINQYSAHCY